MLGKGLLYLFTTLLCLNLVAVQAQDFSSMSSAVEEVEQECNCDKSCFKVAVTFRNFSDVPDKDGFEWKFTLTGDYLDLRPDSVKFFITTDGKEVEYDAELSDYEGWQYIQRITDEPGDEDVSAYAIAYDEDGELYKTETTTVNKDEANPVAAFKEDFNCYDSTRFLKTVSMFGGLNWEFQAFTNLFQNVYIEDGKLYLMIMMVTDYQCFDEKYLTEGVMDMKDLFGICTDPRNYGCSRRGQDAFLPAFFSGRVVNLNYIFHGRLDLKVRFSKGNWLWPNAALFPVDNVYGEWPESGMIILGQLKGNLEEGAHGIHNLSSHVRWGTTDNLHSESGFTEGDVDMTEGFHTLTLEWSHNKLVISIDGDEKVKLKPSKGNPLCKLANLDCSKYKDKARHYRMAPFDQPFQLVVQLNIGSNVGHFPDDYDYGIPKPWTNFDEHAAEDFYKSKSYESWNLDTRQAAMVIDSITYTPEEEN